MSKFLISIFLVLLVGCKPEKKEDYYSDEKNEVEYLEFTFPTLEEWTECYSDKEVKEHFDSFSTFEKFKTIGVYLNSNTYSKKDSLNTIDFEDYSLFMFNKNEQQWKLTGDDLERIFGIQKKKKGIATVDKDIALNKVFSDTTFLHSEKPIIIQEYKSDENILSAVKLLKPFDEYPDIVIVYVFNLIIIKNHLVYASYYLDYNGTESIERVKKNNDIIVSKFLSANK